MENVPQTIVQPPIAVRNTMTMPPLTIRDIKARAIIAPLARPIKTAAGDVPAAPLVLIDIQTNEGITGRAYIFGYTPLTLRPLIETLRNLTEMLKGKSVAPAERMREYEAAFRLLGRQGILGMALSGLDMACWDALGQARKMPVAELLGGVCKPIRAYDSYGVINPKTDAADIEQSLKNGFKAIKIKVGVGDLQKDVATVAAVRGIIGDNIRLMVDYNQCLSVPEAVRRINRLAEFDLDWVEEPVPAEDLAGHATVRSKCAVAIQTGENWWFPEDAARAIAAGASDFAMLDLMKIGGVTGWLHAAGQAAGASLPVSSHLFIEASAHTLSITPNADWLEYLDVAGAILKQPLTVEDGNIQARGPGLGLDWNEEAVKRYEI